MKSPLKKTDRIMLYLFDNDHCTSAEIAHALQIPYNTVSGTSTYLITRKLVYKDSSVQPTRYGLTDKGRVKAEQIKRLSAPQGQSGKPEPSPSDFFQMPDLTDSNPVPTELLMPVTCHKYISYLNERHQRDSHRITTLTQKIEQMREDLERLRKGRDLRKILVYDSNEPESQAGLNDNLGKEEKGNGDCQSCPRNRDPNHTTPESRVSRVDSPVPDSKGDQ